MTVLSEADQYLLDQIRRGASDGWEELIERYQGRLLAFAQGRLPQRADAEDIVQDTFINFLKGLDNFRGQASLETFLFTILRRKIIDVYRGGASKKISLIQDLYTGDPDAHSPVDPMATLADDEPTASWYLQRDEEQQARCDALTAALTEVVNRLKESKKLRDMKIIELLFYCRLSNKDIAEIMDLRENNIALIKHRQIKQLQERIDPDADAGLNGFEEMLNAIWQDQRLSCPKRSTIGAYLLETLEEEWTDYVEFHLSRLGCHFCRANLEDLKRQTADGEQNKLKKRILESSVGFLRKP
jgi:RNA polymerase sigma factor (sigma-70 family)